MDRLGEAEKRDRLGADTAGPAPHPGRRPPVPPEREPVLAGVMLDAAAVRKRAQDEAYQASPDGILMRELTGG